MKETMIMDGHEYFKREDGIWETKDRFEMKIVDWVVSGNHVNHFGTFITSDEKYGCPAWVAIDDVGRCNIDNVSKQPGVYTTLGQISDDQIVLF